MPDVLPSAPPLLVFSDDWGRHPSSCQHLVRQMLARYSVFWVNTIGMRTPRLDLATLRRGFEKVGHWLWPRARSDKLPDNLRVLNPRMWPWFSSRFDRRLNRRLLGRPLGRLVQSLPVLPIAITTLPIVADLMDVLPVRRWVYYCVDDFGQWPGLDQATLRSLEARVVQRADVLIAVSEVLQERLAGMGRSSFLLTHGVDAAYWQANGAVAPIPELEPLERPLVVFWGVIDRRMDVAWVRQLGADLERGTIVLVGPEADPDPVLYQSPRVVHVPPLLYQQLPRLAAEAAVLIMPYADLPVTRAIQPLKLKEYLATGKPVVVRDLPATRSWADCLDLVDSPARFSEAVRRCLHDGVSAEQQRNRTRLAAESWVEKARSFEHWALDTTPADPM